MSKNQHKVIKNETLIPPKPHKPKDSPTIKRRKSEAKKEKYAEKM